MPTTRRICPATLFFLLCLYGLTFYRYRTLWREYCDLADSYAGVHAGLLLVQARDASRLRGRDSGYGRTRALNLAATFAPRVEFSDS